MSKWSTIRLRERQANQHNEHKAQEAVRRGDREKDDEGRRSASHNATKRKRKIRGRERERAGEWEHLASNTAKWRWLGRRLATQRSHSSVHKAKVLDIAKASHQCQCQYPRRRDARKSLACLTTTSCNHWTASWCVCVCQEFFFFSSRLLFSVTMKEPTRVSKKNAWPLQLHQ